MLSKMLNVDVECFVFVGTGWHKAVYGIMKSKDYRVYHKTQCLKTWFSFKDVGPSI